jgi:hypothetical protein
MHNRVRAGVEPVLPTPPSMRVRTRRFTRMEHTTNSGVTMRCHSEIAHYRAHSAPLFPVTQTHPTADPRVQCGDRAIVVRNARIAHPTPDVLGELVEPVGHRHPLAPAGKDADAVAKISIGLIGPAQPRSGSNSGPKTCAMACWFTRSTTGGIPSNRSPLAHFGMVTRRTGWGS